MLKVAALVGMAGSLGFLFFVGKELRSSINKDKEHLFVLWAFQFYAFFLLLIIAIAIS